MFGAIPRADCACAHRRSATCTSAGSGDDDGGKSDAEDLAKAPPHAAPRRSALANAALYGTINGIVAVPAMVSFVAIIFQVRATSARTVALEHNLVMRVSVSLTAILYAAHAADS